MPSVENPYFRGSVLSEITEAVKNLETLSWAKASVTILPAELGLTRRAAMTGRHKGGDVGPGAKKSQRAGLAHPIRPHSSLQRMVEKDVWTFGG